MPGRKSESKTLQFVGLVALVVAIIGQLFFGWEYGSGGMSSAILGVAVAIAVVLVYVFVRR